MCANRLRPDADFYLLAKHGDDSRSARTTTTANEVQSQHGSRSVFIPDLSSGL